MFKHWGRQDWMVVGGGLVAFVFSLFDYVGVSLGHFGSFSINAWHSYAIVGMLLILAAAAGWALLALKAIQIPKLPVKWELIAATATSLGTLLIVVRAAAYPSPVGIRFGGIVVILAGFVMTAGAVWALSAGSAVSDSTGPVRFASGFRAGGRPPGTSPAPGSSPASGYVPSAPPSWSPPAATPPRGPVEPPPDPSAAHPSRPPSPGPDPSL
jgi:hypothetical protein